MSHENLRQDGNTWHVGLCMGLLTLSISLPSWAATPISQQARLQVTGAGVQRVDLPPDAVAVVYGLSEQALRVVDARDQVMPMRMVTPMQTARVHQHPLGLYRWPAAAQLNPDQALGVKLQLESGQTRAMIQWPDLALDSTTATDTDQTWLLVLPNPHLDSETLTEGSRRLILTWPSQNLAVTVQIEGSDDLVDWQAAGSGSVLQTTDESGKVVRQNTLAPMGHYRYWRLHLSEPVALQSVILQDQPAAQAQVQTQAVRFEPSTQLGQWQVHLPQAWPVLGWQWQIPMDQVWTFDVQMQTQTASDLKPRWQTIRQASLYHWQHPPAGQAAEQNRVSWQTPQQASDWRLVGQGPVGAMQALAIMPKRELWFLAQGEAPYRLLVYPHISLPLSILPSPLPTAQPATIGELTTIATPTPWRRYGLWGFLLLMVLVLAVLAVNVIRGLDKTSDKPSDQSSAD